MVTKNPRNSGSLPEPRPQQDAVLLALEEPPPGPQSLVLIPRRLIVIRWRQRPAIVSLSHLPLRQQALPAEQPLFNQDLAPCVVLVCILGHQADGLNVIDIL